jgi:hypothetical protein
MRVMQVVRILEHRQGVMDDRLRARHCRRVTKCNSGVCGGRISLDDASSRTMNMILHTNSPNE